MAKNFKILIIVIISIMILTIINPINGASAYSKRHTKETTTHKPEKQPECQRTAPCGWAIYTPFTRSVEFFMKNTCECAPTTKCIRTDDDLSISAYVYRCRERE